MTWDKGTLNGTINGENAKQYTPGHWKHGTLSSGGVPGQISSPTAGRTDHRCINTWYYIIVDNLGRVEIYWNGLNFHVRKMAGVVLNRMKFPPNKLLRNLSTSKREYWDELCSGKKFCVLRSSVGTFLSGIKFSPLLKTTRSRCVRKNTQFSVATDNDVAAGCVIESLAPDASKLVYTSFSSRDLPNSFDKRKTLNICQRGVWTIQTAGQ